MAKVSEFWHKVVVRLTEAGSVDERKVYGSSVSRQKVRDWVLREACAASRRSGYREESAGADRVNLLDDHSRTRLVFAVARCRSDDDECGGECLG